MIPPDSARKNAPLKIPPEDSLTETFSLTQGWIFLGGNLPGEGKVILRGEILRSRCFTLPDVEKSVTKATC